MKRIVVIIILMAFVGAVAFASLRTNKTGKEKVPAKQEKKTDKKKECKRTCMFS